MLQQPARRLSSIAMAASISKHAFSSRPWPIAAPAAFASRRCACHCAFVPFMDSSISCRRTSSIGTSTSTAASSLAWCQTSVLLNGGTVQPVQQMRSQAVQGRRRICKAVCAKGKQTADEDGEADGDDDEPATAGRPVRVERLLANLGYGKRKECQAVVKRGRVTRVTSGKPARVGDKVRHGEVLLDGEPLDPACPMAIVLHKPVGYVVTSPDDERVLDPVVYDLLPHRFGRRRPFLSCVGRLDKDTSGLLVLTDDGQLLHRITSPRKGIWKRYRAKLAKPLTGTDAAAMARKFASGTLLLGGDRVPLLPARLDMVDDVTAEVALCEGRYHQIRRMFGSQGYEVVSLHRHTIGGLDLTGVEEGTWRFATYEDIQAVFDGPDLEVASELQHKRSHAEAAPTSTSATADAAMTAASSPDGADAESDAEEPEGCVEEYDATEGVEEHRTLQRRYRSSDRWKQRRGLLKRQVGVLAAQHSGGSGNDSD